MSSAAEYRARRYRELVEKFCALDSTEAGFLAKYRLICVSARATMNGANSGIGNPENFKIARAFASEKRKREAQAIREDYMKVVRKIQKKGITSLRGIADELNARKVQPQKADTWTFSMVRELLKNYEANGSGED